MILLKLVNTLISFETGILWKSRTLGRGPGSNLFRPRIQPDITSPFVTWNKLPTSTSKANVTKKRLIVGQLSPIMQQYTYDYTSDQFPELEQPGHQRRQQQLPPVVLKLRGLPWTSTVTDIIEFFGSSVSIANGNDGIHLITSPEGRATGEAYIEVSTENDVQEGLKKNKNTMGHRYIEVFKAKRAEMDWILRKNDPSYVGSTDDGGGYGSGYGYGSTGSGVASYESSEQIAQIPNPFAHLSAEECETFVRLRGLPFECSTNDIFHFFKGLEVDPNGIHMVDDGTGRTSGEAYIQLTSKEDAEKALELDRQCIGHRYIEVFRVGPSELRNYNSNIITRSRSQSRYSTRPGPYDRSSRDGARGGRYGAEYSRRPERYFSGVGTGTGSYDEELSYSYGGSGTEGTATGWSRMTDHNPLDPPPPPPPPLIPGLKRPGGNGYGGESKNWILMRGLPFKSKEADILEFFQPLAPVSIQIIYDASGRPSGTAKVVFSSPEDVSVAMGKHKNLMEHRYIELFPGGL